MIPMYRHQDEEKRIREAARSSTMKNLVSLLCVISALLGSVFSYKCISGLCRNSTTCDASVTDCYGNQCMTISQYIYNNRREYWSMLKGCANETVCGANGSAISEANFEFHSYVNCCSGELCNTHEFEIPKEDPTPNGVKCPGSYCANSTDECRSDKVINCTGSMDRCFEYREHVIDQVFSYQCISGLCRNSTTCDESVTECFGDRCMTISQYIYLNGTVYRSILKGCANETVCGSNGSAIAEKFKFQDCKKCCTGDLCNTDEYEVPAEDQTPNGIKCPTAYCTGTTDDCKSDKVINCTGSMDRCFEYRKHVIDEGEKNEKYFEKGCINSDACKYNLDNDVAVYDLEKKNVSCYIPSKSNNLQ